MPWVPVSHLWLSLPVTLRKGESVLSRRGSLIHPAGFGAVSSDGNLIVYPGATDLIPVTFGPWSETVKTGASLFITDWWLNLSVEWSSCNLGWWEQGVIWWWWWTIWCWRYSHMRGWYWWHRFSRGWSLLQIARTVIQILDPCTMRITAPGTGSIVFEADWSKERIWRLPAGDTEPVPGGDFGNDNSPCVWLDGRIVSLWLDRQDNANSLHEIKVMSPDGGTFMMLSIKKDVLDSGIGCGGK